MNHPLLGLWVLVRTNGSRLMSHGVSGTEIVGPLMLEET